ncbi:MAG: universal stress protein [Candidatus Delongbacteria bacterium]|nr:universal stress protein [Candidatus Delongbacteria bacterium]
MKNILAPIDFSDVSEKVIFEAAELAKVFSCKLWLLHVAAPEPDFVGYTIGPKEERDWRALTLHNEHKYIQEKALFLEKEGIQVTPLLVQGVTVDTILKKIDKFDIDMVVMGTHGHGALYSLVAGSVSNGVVQESKVPVMLVPSK